MCINKLPCQNGVNKKTGLRWLTGVELCSRKVKETDTENMWKSKRRTDGAC